MGKGHLGLHLRGGGGGSIPVTSYQGTLINTTGGLAGSDFIPILSKSNGVAGVNVDTQLNGGPAGMVFGSGSGVNDNAMRATFYPKVVSTTEMVNGSLSRGQFAQWEIVSRAVGIDCEVSLVLFGRPWDGDDGYAFNVQSESTSTGLAQGVGTAAVYAIRANCFANAPGDIVRVECRWSAASNELRTYKNGVLQTTDVDNNAARPQGGLAGFGFLGVFTGVMVFKNLSLGLL